MEMTPEAQEEYDRLPEERDRTESPYRLHQEYRHDPEYQEALKHAHDRRVIVAKTALELKQERIERRRTLSRKTYRFQDWRGETIIFALLVIMIVSGILGHYGSIIDKLY